jgi:1-deoxy-D-xylulose-5-phosphate synthase
MVAAAEEAAELLEARDVQATVWDVRTIPADPKMLADARRHPLVITAEDGVAEGAVGALLAAALGALEAGTPAPPTVALGVPAAYLPHGKPADLLANLGLDGPGVAATVAKLLDAPSG